MIGYSEHFRCPKDEGVEFFPGVPDLLLKCFCAYITVNTNENNHISTANHIANEKTLFVYLQNSGLGNMINPVENKSW